MPDTTRVPHMSADSSSQDSADPNDPVSQALSLLGLPWTFQFEQPDGQQATDLMATQLGLNQLAFTEAYLQGARRFIDLWRSAVREQQDHLLAAWRAQLHASVSRTLLPADHTSDKDTQEHKGNSAAGPQTPRRTASGKGRPKVDHTEGVLLSREH